jgi:hypothetical protein
MRNRPTLAVNGWRYGLLGLMGLLLTACASAALPSAVKVLPAITSTPTARRQAIEAAPSDPVDLAAGQYQFLEFYSPL